MPNCPNCGNQLGFIQQYGFWYCYACQQYFQPEHQPPQQIQPTPYYSQQAAPPQQSVPPSGKSKAPLIAAVIIIVAIVFIATIFFWIMVPDEGDEDNGNSTHTTTPAISMYWDEDPEEPGNYVGFVVSISGTGSISTDDVTITVTHGGQSEARDLDVIAGGLPLQVGDLTLDFTDLTPTEKLGAEDVFSIVGGQSGDVIRLVYAPTSGLMCSTTLT